MAKIKTTCRKITALLLTFCFVFQNSGEAQSVQGRIALSPANSEVSVWNGSLSLLPASLGRVEEVWTPANGADSPGRVVLIQDAHGQEEAQKNTQSILEFLHPRLKFSQIILEGGFGKLDPSRLIYFNEAELNRKAADFLFRESEIGGPELFLLSEERSKESLGVEGWGAEDKALYLENLRAYQDVHSFGDKASLVLEKSLAGLRTEASRKMNEALYRFFMQWMDFESGKLSLEQDIHNVQDASALSLGLQWEDARLQLEWPMLVRYQELKRRETLLNKEAADQQAEALLVWAAGRLEKKALSDLKNLLSKELSNGAFQDRRVFWERFYGETSGQGFAFEQYPDFFRLEGFRILEGEIEGTRLFEEVNRLRGLVLEKLQKLSIEKEIVEAFRDYLLLRKLFLMTLTREEFSNLEKRFGARKKIPESLRPFARKALRYYQLALSRDEVMAGSVIRRLRETSNRKETVVLIAGGFHRRGLSEMFRREGVPYSVFSPHFTDIQGMEKYEDSMTGRGGPFDLSFFDVRGAQWMNDWQGGLPQPVSARRAALESAILKRGMELGAVPRSELRAQAVWKDLTAAYADVDRLAGRKKTSRSSKTDPETVIFLKFIRHQTELQTLLAEGGDRRSLRQNKSTFYSILTDWFDGHVYELLSLLEENKDVETLGQLLEFSRIYSTVAYADLVESSLNALRQQTSRSELRASGPWKSLSEAYDDIDRLTGLKKTPGRKKKDPAMAVFLKFVRHETELRALLAGEGDLQTQRIFYGILTDWLDGHLNALLTQLEEERDAGALTRLLEFSRSYMESAYANELISGALSRVREASAVHKKLEGKKKRRKSKAPSHLQPRKFSKRPKTDSVRPYASTAERQELFARLGAAEIPSPQAGTARFKLTLGPDFFKGANPWLPMANDAVKLSFPKALEGKTLVLEESELPGDKGLRLIRVYENSAEDKNYLFGFMESETLGFSRTNDSFFVSPDYTFTHPQFPEETFWVLTTQGFDVKNPQNKFRVLTDAKGRLQKVIDASAAQHPVYEVYDETGKTRKGFFVMRMDGLWSPSEDFRGIVKGYRLGRERSQRGEAHNTAYIRVPGKNIYVAPGIEGLKKAEVLMEGRTPVSVKVGDKTYPLILKRDQKGTLIDVAREGFYDKLGTFTGTVTRFKADHYGRASLGAPVTGAQVADASKNEVWMSAALENGVVIRTDEWKNLPPESPYVFEMEEAEKPAEGVQVQPRVLSLRLAENKVRPKKTHDFLVLRDFQGSPSDSFKLRISGDKFEKHEGQVTGFTIHARGETAGRLLVRGRDYQLPGEYRDHPVTLLQFPAEKKLIFIVHSKTRTQIKDAYVYEMDGGEYKGGARETAGLEKELKAQYRYPFDLSRVWREKIRSEEAYEKARADFERGDLDSAERVLHEVSLKARRHYRLAQQLLNIWIPKRRRVLSSGTETQQRRLLASFERAFRETPPSEESSSGARSELRAFDTESPLFWTGVAAGISVALILAAYRARLLYQRIILEDYDERVAALKETAADYRKQAAGLKASQRLRARQKAAKAYSEKFKLPAESSGFFAEIASLFIGSDAARVYQKDQNQRAQSVIRILERRLAYELALAERGILRKQGAGPEELRKAWPSDLRLPLRERARDFFVSLKRLLSGFVRSIIRGFLETVSAIRQSLRAKKADSAQKMPEPRLDEKVVSEAPLVEADLTEDVQSPAQPEAETLPEKITEEQKVIRAAERFKTVFFSKASLLVRQAEKAESLKRAEQILSDFERELKTAHDAVARAESLTEEPASFYSDQVLQADWVLDARLKIQARLEEIKTQKEKASAERRAAREAAEEKKKELQRKRSEAEASLRDGLTVLETDLRKNFGTILLRGQAVSQQPEAIALGLKIKEQDSFRSLEREIWQRRLADLLASLQREYERQTADPWILDRAVRQAPDAIALAEEDFAEGKETLAEDILKALVWDLDRDSAERNLAVRRLLEFYKSLELFDEGLAAADHLVWLLNPEPATNHLLAELWFRQARFLIEEGKTEEARGALDAAEDLLRGADFEKDELRKQVEKALEGLPVETSSEVKGSSRIAKPLSSTRQFLETQGLSPEEFRAEPSLDFSVLFSRLEGKLLAEPPVFDRESLLVSGPALQAAQEIANARVDEAQKEALWDRLDQLAERVVEKFQKDAAAETRRELEGLYQKIERKLRNYKFPQDVFEDPEVTAFTEKLENLHLAAEDKDELTQDFMARMSFFGALVWREMNRRGLEYVRKHSRTLSDFLQSVSLRIEEAKKLKQQGRNAEAFDVYEEVARDVRDEEGQEVPEEVRLSTLSRVIVGMSNTLRYDFSRPDRYEAALRILDEALENVDPWSPYLAVEKGWVLYHWGKTLSRQKRSDEEKFEQALFQADILLLREPREPGALDLKVAALTALNRKNEAITLAHWIDQQGIRKFEQLTAYRELSGQRSELRAERAPWVRDTDQSVTIQKARSSRDLLSFIESDAVLDLLMQTLFQIRMLREEPGTGERKAKRIKKQPAGEIENPAALVVQRVYEFWHQNREFKTPDELTAFFEPLEVLARRADGVAPFLVRGLQAKLFMMAGFRENATKEIVEGWPKYDRENFAFALAGGDAQAALSPYTAIGLQKLFAAMDRDLQMVKLEATGLKAEDFDSFVTLVRSYHFWRAARSRWDSAAAQYQEAGPGYELAVNRARRAAVYAEERLHRLEEKYTTELGLAEIPEDLTAKQELEVAFNRYRLALAVISPTFSYHVFNGLMAPVLETLAMDKAQGMQARTLLRARKVAEGLAAVVEHKRTHTIGDVTLYEDVLEILATAQVHVARALKKLESPSKTSEFSPFAARLDGLIELMDRELARGFIENQRSIEIYYRKLLEAVVVFERILQTAKKNTLKGRDLVDLLDQARILKEFFGKEPDSVSDNHKTFLDSLKKKGYEAEALNEGLKSLEHFLLEETHFNLPRSELRHSPFEPFVASENVWVREGALEPFPGVTLQSIARAQKMLRHFWAGIGEIREEDSRNGHFQVPLVESAALNVLMENLTGIKNRYYLYYLPELPEGSFKPYLAADLLDRFFDHPETLANLQMVVAESTGNQGKAVASLVQKLKKHPDYAPYAQNLRAVIFVPRTANSEKVRAMKNLGAVVVNRAFSSEELRRYVNADERGRSEIAAASKAPYFESYKDASAYVSVYAEENPETSHYIRHGAPMGVAAYSVIMLEALDQWYRLQRSKLSAQSPEPVSSADFDAFIKFVAERPEFADLRFWIPAGSGGLASGIAQIKQFRPDAEVFLTQVPGVDHVFNSLRAGHLISKEQAVFDPEALRYVDGIAATAEETTYKILAGMADAVMRVPYQDNNRMARLMMHLGISYVNDSGEKRSLESELSPFLPLTNAVYARAFQPVLPALGESGKHILIPVTGRTINAELEEEIRNISFHDAGEVLRSIALRSRPVIPDIFASRSELRALEDADRKILTKIEKDITDRKLEETNALMSDFSAEVLTREDAPEKTFILQNLDVYKARLSLDEGNFAEARRLLDGVEAVNPDFKDAATSKSLPAYREAIKIFEKYKTLVESQGYDFIRKLGTGTFGDGYLFQHKVDGRKAVLKLIGGTSLDMTDMADRMSASGQLAVEIDVNDRFFAGAGDDPSKAVIPRNIEVFEGVNELEISMPEAILMNFLEGRPASDFLKEADADERRIFFEQVEDKWIDLIRSLKAGGYLLLDYRPDNFFFKVVNGNLVIESVDRGIMFAYPKLEDEELKSRRELSAVGAASVWKDITGQPATLEFRDRIRAAFDLEPETETYMKKTVRPGDEARIPQFSELLNSLGFEFRGDDGKIGYTENFKPLETAYNLILIPHGVTDANQRNVFHGRADSKDENLLNDEGRLQVKEGAAPLAELIRSLRLNPEDLVYLSSPLMRAQQTAFISLKELETLLPGFNHVAEIDPDVMELSFGEWDGKDLAEIETSLGAEEKENAEKYRSLNALMRSASGENFLMLLSRVRKVLESWNQKYPGKTVVVYGHGTFAAAVRVLMQSPEAQLSDYVTWRDSAVPPRGKPTLFPARSELRQEAVFSNIRSVREVGMKVTAGVFAVSDAAGLISSGSRRPFTSASDEMELFSERQRRQEADIFSAFLDRGGKAILPAKVVAAVTPRARELFIEMFVQGAAEFSGVPRVYIAGEGAGEVKGSFFTYGIFQKVPAAQKLFEIRSQTESVMANRLSREAVALSLAAAPAADEEAINAAIPAFLLRPEEVRKLGEADQARLLVRMTQLQLLAAVELKDQLGDAGKGTLDRGSMAAFLQKTGVGFSLGEGGFWAPSVQSLLSETVASRLAAFAATGKSA